MVNRQKPLVKLEGPKRAVGSGARREIRLWVATALAVALASFAEGVTESPVAVKKVVKCGAQIAIIDA